MPERLSASERARAWLAAHQEFVAVALVALVSFFGRSWEGDLHGDPVRYAAIAKTMLKTGDWVTLQDAPGVFYGNKPPLMIWLTAANFTLFGPSTFAAKFWSCLFAAASCLLTYLLGRRLFGATAGMLAGCCLALTPGVVLNAIDLRLDSAVVLAAVATAYAMVRAADDGSPLPATGALRWLLLAGLAGGLGAMTKIAAGVHVAALVVLVSLARKPRLLIHPCLFGAVALALAVAAPWHLAVAARRGAEFTGTYFGEEMANRLVFGSHIASNLLYNAAGLLVRGAPWWLLAGWAVVRWRRGSARGRAGLLLALLWAGEVFLFAAIPPKRYDRYLIPAYPAIALLAGHGIVQLLSERLRAAAPAFLHRVAIAWAFVLAVVPLSLHTYSCHGFVEIRPLLDRMMPGSSIAAYDEKFPTGLSRSEEQWGLRAKAGYYLDRTLINCRRLDDLPAAGQPFILAKENSAEQLAKAGFLGLHELDDRYWLFYRPTR